METSTIGGATLFVKKIVSLSPDKFGFMSLQSALDKYHQYLFSVHDHYIEILVNGTERQKGIYKVDSAKGFKEWLRTEI